jgi:hypothetical protein
MVKIKMSEGNLSQYWRIREYPMATRDSDPPPQLADVMDSNEGIVIKMLPLNLAKRIVEDHNSILENLKVTL